MVARFSPDGATLVVERIMLHGGVGDAEWVDDDQLVCGQFQASDSLWDMALDAQAPYGDGFLARADTTGHVQWLTRLTSDFGASFSQCLPTNSGNIVVSGSFGGHAYFGTDTLTAGSFIDTNLDTISSSNFIAKYSPSGSLIWVSDLYSTSFYTMDDMVIGSDGFIYIQGNFSGDLRIGTTMLHTDANAEMYVAKLDTQGNCVAVLKAGGTWPYGGGSLLANERGLFASFKYYTPFSIGATGIRCDQDHCSGTFIAKFDSLSGFTGIASMALGEEGLHIYANPNNGLCTIDLPQQLQMTNDLVLSIFDNTGQLVQQVPVEYTGSSLQLDIQAQSHGIYHVELSDGVQRYSGSIVFE